MKRRLENAAYRAKRRDAKTVTDSLNEFRKQVCVANYRLCVLCNQFFLNNSAIEISVTDSRYEELDLENKKNLRRLNKHWLCLLCKSSGKKQEISLSRPFMKSIIIDGHHVLYPCPSQDQQQDDGDIFIDSLILIPKTYFTNNQVKQTFVPNMYTNPNPTNQFISTLYSNRMDKFNKRAKHASFFDGEIQNRKLTSISKIYDESSIRSSKTWRSKKQNMIKCEFFQFGQSAIAFSIDINRNNIETIITSLLCAGSVITMEFNGDINNEFKTHYYSHSHDNSEACDNNCIKTELLDVDDSLGAEYIPVYISSLCQKQNAFVQNFIKNKNFELYSENFNCGLEFYLNGSARITGIVWTQECLLFNESLSSSSLTGEEFQMEDFLTFIENSILTSTNAMEIKENLGVNDEEALNIHRLALAHQIDLNMKQEYLNFPSYESMYTVKPQPSARFNLVSSKRLLEWCKMKMMELTSEDKLNMKTEDWLLTLSSQSKFILDDEDEDEEKISIELPEIKIVYKLDERLNSLITKYGAFIGIVAIICNSIQP